MAKIPKIPVLHIHHNNDAFLYPAIVREDKLYCKNERVPEYENRAVITVHDMRFKRMKKWKMVIYLDGKRKASTIQNGKEMKATIKAEDQAEIDWINNMLGTKYTVEDVLNSGKLETIPDSVESIFEPLTFKDRITVVKREIAKQLGKFKPMETWQFILLIALVAGLYAIQFIFK